MVDTKEWEIELEKRLRKLYSYLNYKNHGFCRNYLGNILKDFFKKGADNIKKRKGK